MITAVAFAAVFASMLAEASLSARHERLLRAAGAFEPPDDVYRVMQRAYPGAFLAMFAEAALRGLPPWGAAAAAGAALFVAAKALKYWAIASLGVRWTFRVLVPPGQPLVRRGPYRWLRHPNYVAVAGELLGAAIGLRALASGPVVTTAFVALMLRRIRIEEKALAR